MTYAQILLKIAIFYFVIVISCRILVWITAYFSLDDCLHQIIQFCRMKQTTVLIYIIHTQCIYQLKLQCTCQWHLQPRLLWLCY